LSRSPDKRGSYKFGPWTSIAIGDPNVEPETAEGDQEGATPGAFDTREGHKTTKAETPKEERLNKQKESEEKHKVG
jgi:hypothetical protein